MEKQFNSPDRYKTRAAAEKYALRTNKDFIQLGLESRWVAVQLSNGWWTIEKLAA